MSDKALDMKRADRFESPANTWRDRYGGPIDADGNPIDPPLDLSATFHKYGEKKPSPLTLPGIDKSQK